ncbi:hypothetical protein [Streptomyces sp. NPDC056670]|uniref:hypothetical protein n=1 Tax=Streptomyces sp. NPDC056670 TaxID=3345904 RepID=UPI0036868177
MSTRYTCRHDSETHTAYGDVIHRTCGCDGTVHHACSPRPAPAGTPRPEAWPACLAWRTAPPAPKHAVERP